MKGRYLITQKQIENIRKYAMINDAVKILRIIREVEHMQYIGDTERKSVKDDLRSLRLTI